MKRWGIQKKVTVSFLGAILCALVLGWAVFAALSATVLVREAQQDLEQTALQISSELRKKVSRQIELARTCSQFPSVFEAVQAGNQALSGLTKPLLAQKIREIESQWGEEGPQAAAALERIFSSRASKDLQDIQKFKKEEVAELFATDKFGTLVASTNKTTDYFQADEAWWQEAFNQGRGKPAIGELEYDESARVHALSVSVPVYAGAEAAGVLKMVVSARDFFEPLSGVKMGETGEAFLCDASGRVLFGRGVSHLEEKLPALKVNVTGMGLGKLFDLGREKRVAAASIAVPAFPKFGAGKSRGKEVRVVAVKALSEVLQPFYRIHAYFWAVSLVCYALLIVWGKYLSRRILSALGTLESASRRIISGESPKDLDIHTHDELEGLSQGIKMLMGEIHSTQQNLMKSHQDLENVLNAVVDALFVIGPGGEIRRVNAAACALLGYGPEELSGMNFSRLLFEEKEIELSQFILNQLRQKKVAAETTLTLRAKNGGPVPVRCRGASISSSPQEPPLAVITARPAQEALPEAGATQFPQLIDLERNQMLNDVVRGMVHEVNNPLTAILGFSELIKEGPLDQKTLENAEKIFNEARRCRKILEDLQTFLRRKAPMKQQVNLADVVERVCLFLSPRMRAGGIQVEKKLPVAAEAAAYADPVSAQQALLGVVANAIEALETKEGEIPRWLRIGVAKAGGVVRLTVEDNGPGIPPQNREKLFSPFFTTKPGRLGLGLAMVSALMEQQGGSARADGAAPAGAKFVLEFPAAAADALREAS